jgi:tRNA threonylcarbamoyladenosine dehydratase
MPTLRLFPERFGGIERLYGSAAIPHLRAMHVCVIGIGGVGSWAAEALARSGIGTLTLIDHDEVCISNVNRQLHALGDTVGAKKVRSWRSASPPSIPMACHVVDDFITRDNYRELLSPERGYDYVIDAIDSIQFKAMIIYTCKRNKIPVITTGGAGGLTDPTMIQVRDLSRTYNDPLAAKVRARLRDDFNFSRNARKSFGVECVFSGQQQLYPRGDGTVGHDKPGIHGVHLDCRFGYGSASFVTGSFAFAAVARVIHKTLRKETPDGLS